MHVKGRHYLFFSSADSCRETRKLFGIVTIPQPAMSIERLISRRIELRVDEESGWNMMERKLTIAEIILIAGTRIALGARIGLLLFTKLNNDQPKAAGVALAGYRAPS